MVLPRDDAVGRDGVTPRAHEYAGDDFLDKLLGSGGHELCTRVCAAVGEGLLVTDGDHAAVDGVGVGELAGFGGEWLGVAFADFEVPI